MRNAFKKNFMTPRPNKWMPRKPLTREEMIEYAKQLWEINRKWFPQIIKALLEGEPKQWGDQNKAKENNVLETGDWGANGDWPCEDPTEISEQEQDYYEDNFGGVFNIVASEEELEFNTTDEYRSLEKARS